jgi:hypothetical protein
MTEMVSSAFGGRSSTAERRAVAPSVRVRFPSVTPVIGRGEHQVALLVGLLQPCQQRGRSKRVRLLGRKPSLGR